jgi:hypothetical protein
MCGYSYSAIQHTLSYNFGIVIVFVLTLGLVGSLSKLMVKNGKKTEKICLGSVLVK